MFSITSNAQTTKQCRSGLLHLGRRTQTLGSVRLHVMCTGLTYYRSAPEDKVVNAVDEILNYAIQPGNYRSTQLATAVTKEIFIARIPHVLPHRPGILLYRGTKTRSLEPRRLHLHLLVGRFSQCHGHKTLWRRRETHLPRKQPVYSSQYLRVWNSRGVLHPRANELFQQGSGHFLDQCVCSSIPYCALIVNPLSQCQSHVLCRIFVMYHPCLPHPLSIHKTLQILFLSSLDSLLLSLASISSISHGCPNLPFQLVIQPSKADL